MNTGLDRIAKLGWQAKLEESSLNRLFAGDKITVVTMVKIEGPSGTKTWPAEKAGISVYVDESRKNLKIYYAPWRYVRGRNGFWTWQEMVPAGFAICPLIRFGNVKAGLIFKSGYVAPGKDPYQSTFTQPMSVSVQIGSCLKLPSAGEKQLECNLKI